MSVRSPLRRVGLYAAAGAVAAMTAAGPALAADPVPGAADPAQPQSQTQPEPQTDPWAEPEAEPQTEPQTEAQAEPQAEPQTEIESRRLYKGRVTAKKGLILRDKPTRSSRVIGFKRHGAIVHIFCKTTGGKVKGNNHWYLLTDGTWAWGSAKYIENIGRAPRWC
ncbi:SH3 domain-containing protein [Streptomyces sp. ISL-98]|uniref:SH3 domain-containing protein n=1 Tax=Streptomyces sp. ISL-98 TaxID=2819192 RepID=UPI001BED13AD|nr:SH3 domain-containing protein [Streptomyces sp. ISL-98]MBT2510001.1 SH3 domain-containing protein [Streptomyces sp. ISL-98]